MKRKSYLRKNKTPRYNQAYGKAVSVGVLFTVQDRQKHDHIKEFIRKLERDGKKVKALGYLPPNQENYEFMFDIFTAREISFWGKIEATSAVEFANTPFDFLICLDSTPNPFLFNIIAKSKAKCRVGKFWEEAGPYFEMMVESYGNSKLLIEHLYQYTSAIR